jgi:hypothetical protein
MSGACRVNIYLDEAAGKLWEARCEGRHKWGTNLPLGEPVTGTRPTL